MSMSRGQGRSCEHTTSCVFGFGLAPFVQQSSWEGRPPDRGDCLYSEHSLPLVDGIKLRTWETRGAYGACTKIIFPFSRKGLCVLAWDENGIFATTSSLFSELG